MATELHSPRKRMLMGLLMVVALFGWVGARGQVQGGHREKQRAALYQPKAHSLWRKPVSVHT